MTQPVAVDSSALVAVLKGEAEEIVFLDVLTSRDVLVGWPTIFETQIWLLRQAPSRSPEWLETFIATPAVRTVAFDGALERIAGSAYERFGKGQHPAALNFGDCTAYAVAAHHKVPLLFKGRDFGKTDVAVHPASVFG